MKWTDVHHLGSASHSSSEPDLGTQTQKTQKREMLNIQEDPGSVSGLAADPDHGHQNWVSKPPDQPSERKQLSGVWGGLRMENITHHIVSNVLIIIIINVSGQLPMITSV